MTGGFQQQVFNQPALGVAGDFASANPFFTFQAGPGGLVAGLLGLVVARFAWVTPPVDPNGAAKIANNFGSGQVAGFVHREQQGLIVDYLAPSGMKIQRGFPATLMIGGDFLMANEGDVQALPGYKAYARFADGSVRFGPAGAAASGATSTASTIATEASSFTGSIVNDLLTVTAVASGVLRNGSVLSGTDVATGTEIVSQVSSSETNGSLGGKGVYLVSIPNQTVASETITGAWGLLTIGGTVAGTFGVGDLLKATGSVIAGTTIRQQLSGDGGAGSTFAVNDDTNVGSQAINSEGDVETKWYATNAALVGELVKTTDHPAG